MPRSPALEGEKLKKAVQMKKDGASYGEIAEEFAVSRGGVYNNVKPMLGSESESERENERLENEQSEREYVRENKQNERKTNGNGTPQTGNRTETETEWGRENKRSKSQTEREAERQTGGGKRFRKPEIKGTIFGCDYDEVERYEEELSRRLESARVARESKTEREAERAKEDEAERLSKTVFRKSLELFIDGRDCEQIAEKLDVPQAAVEYELLPYVNELKTARRLQKKVEEMGQ